MYCMRLVKSGQTHKTNLVDMGAQTLCISSELAYDGPRAHALHITFDTLYRLIRCICDLRCVFSWDEPWHDPRWSIPADSEIETELMKLADRQAIIENFQRLLTQSDPIANI